MDPTNMRGAEQHLFETLLASTDIVPQGAGLRGLSAVPQSLSVRDWSYVAEYHPEDLVVTAGAGTHLSYLNQTLNNHNQWLPLAPIDGGDDTVGGAVAVGLDGWFRGGYGPLRDRILGLRVVTPAFGPLSIGSQVVKNVAGYNLPRLFIGTRGALGIITEVTLKVSPRPERQLVWMRPTDGSNLKEAIATLYSLAPSFASLGLIRQHNRQIFLVAVWHGRDSGHAIFEKCWGPATSETLPTLDTASDEVLAAGAVPRGSVLDLWDYWPSSSALQVDCQSGSFFGTLSGRADWPPLVKWVTQAHGSVRILRDSIGIVPQVSRSDPLWQPLKRHYDPSGCLHDFWG